MIGRNRLIMRWLSHRGGALDYREWRRAARRPAVSDIGGARLRSGDDSGRGHAGAGRLSEYAFAGLLRGAKTEVARAVVRPRHSGARRNRARRFIYPDDEADEGPFGDHTGYYNEVERFPVFTVEAMTMRRDPIYHSTYTGRPPDEPAILGLALNEVFIPLLQKQFPEIVDFYLPAEGCSYRVAIVSIKKQYPGSRQARDDGRLVVSAPVHVHQVRHRRRRRYRCAQTGKT